MVLCRYSPATAVIPKMSVSRDIRPACATACMAVRGWVTSAPPATSPATPTMSSTGPAASSSHGPRMVRSLRISLAMRDVMAGPLVIVGGCEAEEGGLQVAEVFQWAGEPQPTFVDDHYLVDGLGDLAEHVAGDQDRAALVGQIAQQAAQPRHAGRVEPVGRFVEQQNWWVAEQGPGQAEALAHAEGVAAH